MGIIQSLKNKTNTGDICYVKETDEVMKNPDIKLLCPPKKCGKCRRMISRVESVLKEHGVDEKVQIVNDPDELQQYPTWVLPTLVINGEIVARGYVPSSDIIKKYLVKISD